MCWFTPRVHLVGKHFVREQIPKILIPYFEALKCEKSLEEVFALPLGAGWEMMVDSCETTTLAYIPKRGNSCM